MISILEGAAFVLTIIDSYRRYRFAFPVHVQILPPGKLSVDLQNTSTCCHDIPQRLILTSDKTKVQQWVSADGSHRFFHVFHHLDQLNSWNYEITF